MTRVAAPNTTGRSLRNNSPSEIRDQKWFMKKYRGGFTSVFMRTERISPNPPVDVNRSLTSSPRSAVRSRLSSRNAVPAAIERAAITRGTDISFEPAVIGNFRIPGLPASPA
jgi:hypothetical protein